MNNAAFAPALVAPNLQPTPAPSAAELAKRGQIKQAASKFEASFLGVMMQQMFDQVDSDGPFDGGFGEQMFKSLMSDAMAKQITKAGGIGIASAVSREMLKLQGLK